MLVENQCIKIYFCSYHSLLFLNTAVFCSQWNASIFERLPSSTHRKDQCSVVSDPIQCSEPRVVRSSWWSFPVWWRLANRSSNRTVMVFIGSKNLTTLNARCFLTDSFIGPQMWLVLPVGTVVQLSGKVGLEMFSGPNAYELVAMPFQAWTCLHTKVRYFSWQYTPVMSLF